MTQSLGQLVHESSYLHVMFMIQIKLICRYSYIRLLSYNNSLGYNFKLVLSPVHFINNVNF